MAVNTSQYDGKSPLTVEEAGDVFAGLFSDEVPPEDTKSRETPAPTESEQPEGASTDEESTEQQTEQVDPNAAPEEAEEAAPAEGEDAEPETPDEQPEEPQTFTIKVDGKDVAVTLDELQKGYSRHADYTQKTQALAEERRSLEAEAATMRTRNEQYAVLLDKVEEGLKQLTPPEPDWDALRRDNPEEFAVQWAEHQRREEALKAVRSEKDRVFQEQQDALAKAHRAFVASEAEKLIEALPELKDPSKRPEFRKGLAEYGRSVGFTDAELNNVADHRALIILDKARRYDALQAQRPKLKDKVSKIKVLKPGAPRRKAPAPTKGARALERLAKTHSLDDAADAFSELFAD